MFTDRVLRNCIILSIAIHGIALLNINTFKIFQSLDIKPIPKEIEITYHKNARKILPKAIVGKKNKIVKTAPQKEKSVTVEKIFKPVKPVKPAKTATEKIRVAKTELKSQPIVEQEWQIFHKSKDLSSEPSYLTYHNLIRSRIERNANTNKPYTFRAGDVDLVFTVLRSGELKAIKIVSKPHAADYVLRQCALDSVYTASPFSPFTRDMKEDELTLQLTISFEK